ncbi:MAG: glutathione S-transferase family protein [Burkholderiales bacterium]|nr:glutathione S-transferase family protein [Burkholderiales bacterium]
MRVFGDAQSGNCYKVQLLLRQLGRPFEWVPVDVLKQETRTPEFLALNPAGQVPLLVWDDGRCLPESNAILLHVAEGTPLLPVEPWTRAQVYRWLFWEQYQHEPTVAVSRFIVHYLKNPPEQAERLAGLQARAHQALRLMTEHLQRQPFMAGSAYTVADIALYAYTHVAPQGGVHLDPYPALRDWLARVAAQPGHSRMGE